MANIIKRFAHHRDDVRFANFQRVRGVDAEWKLLRCPTEYCLPTLQPCSPVTDSRDSVRPCDVLHSPLLPYNPVPLIQCSRVSGFARRGVLLALAA